jgi:hypothetical protein
MFVWRCSAEILDQFNGHDSRQPLSVLLFKAARITAAKTGAVIALPTICPSWANDTLPLFTHSG